jgi:hypothetical protein
MVFFYLYDIVRPSDSKDLTLPSVKSGPLIFVSQVLHPHLHIIYIFNLGS